MAAPLKTIAIGLSSAVLVVAVAVTASTALAQQQTAASADVRDRLSRFVGTVGFVEEQGGVHLTGVLRNLPAGPHGLHIDNVGTCLSPSFSSAGSIFNPTGKKHGLRNPAGPQLGDLPSLVVSSDGIANLDVMAPGATLSSGPASLIGGNGTALIIHVADDDQLTEPEGNAGDRLACGVILPKDPAAVSATAQARGPSAVAAPTVAPIGAQAPATQVGRSDEGIKAGAPLLAGVLGVLLLGAGYVLRRQGQTARGSRSEIDTRE